MDHDVREAYWVGITVLEAQEALIQMSIADYPYGKKDERRKMHRSMHEKAYPVVHENRNAPIVSMDDFARIMGGLLNG